MSDARTRSLLADPSRGRVAGTVMLRQSHLRRDPCSITRDRCNRPCPEVLASDLTEIPSDSGESRRSIRRCGQLLVYCVFSRHEPIGQRALGRHDDVSERLVQASTVGLDRGVNPPRETRLLLGNQERAWERDVYTRDLQ